MKRYVHDDECPVCRRGRRRARRERIDGMVPALAIVLLVVLMAFGEWVTHL